MTLRFLLAVPFAPLLVRGAALTAGNLLALRVNSGGTLSASSSPIVIDEIAAGTGAIVQSISIPSTGSTAQCTLSGLTAQEGQLTLSWDSSLVSFACYQAISGTGTISVSTPSATNNGRSMVNVRPTGVASTRVSMGSNAYLNRPVYGAVAMNAAYDWYAFGPAWTTTRGLSYVTTDAAT